jgi:hypothetical protein
MWPPIASRKRYIHSLPSPLIETNIQMAGREEVGGKERKGLNRLPRWRGGVSRRLTLEKKEW